MAISSAASTSSKMHIGTGRTFKIANKHEIAINAFSPPENKVLETDFPGGWTSISIPVSKILLGSVYLISALPPPNNSLKTRLNW